MLSRAKTLDAHIMPP